jgi:hypothetical protein
MNILGFSGALEPSKTEKYFTNQSISALNYLKGISIEKESIDNHEFRILRYNPKKKQDEEIDLSEIDPSTYVPILSLLKILIDNTQQEACNQIISFLNDLVKTLSKKDENLVDIILPTIFHIMPENDIDNQQKLFLVILNIITCFKGKIIFHLNSIVQLIKNYIISDDFLETITEILLKLFENYVKEMEKYYCILIPTLLSLIKDTNNSNNEKVNLLKILTLMTRNSNIGTYLNIILEEITVVYIRGTDPKILEQLLEFFEKIISVENTYLFYPLIIRVLIEKLSILLKNESFSSKSVKDKSLIVLMNDGENFNIVLKH